MLKAALFNLSSLGQIGMRGDYVRYDAVQVREWQRINGSGVNFTFESSVRATVLWIGQQHQGRRKSLQQK